MKKIYSISQKWKAHRRAHDRDGRRKRRRGAVHDMQVIIENTIMPSLKLSGRGPADASETMAPKTRVEELEDDMQLLKAVVRSQSERIDALEKAACLNKNPSPYRLISSTLFVSQQTMLSGRWGAFLLPGEAFLILQKAVVTCPPAGISCGRAGLGVSENHDVTGSEGFCVAQDIFLQEY